MVRLTAVVLVCALPATVAVADEPTITILATPAYGSPGLVVGYVTGADDPTDYAVATYIQPEGAGWWSKPYAASGMRTVPVDSGGLFTVDVTTGGAGSADPQAVLYAVKLTGAGPDPPLAAGSQWLPESPLFLAEDIVERYRRTIDFAGYTWGVKQSPIPVGPGSNRFSDDADNVWVDLTGRLHLTVRQEGADYYSTEIILTESLGYGRYLFHTSTPMDELDTSIIFGAFLWDAFGEPDLPGYRANREVDFEDAVWPGDPPGNTQFVVQDWDTAGNLHRFALPDLGSPAYMTRILTWSASHLHFQMLRGLHSFNSWTPDDVVEQWPYRHDPAADHFVPDAERERFRFNLHLHKGLVPAGDGRSEIIVNHFAYTYPGDADGDGDVDLDDFVRLKINWGAADAGYDQGDFDGDGEVDLDDFVILKNNFGRKH